MRTFLSVTLFLAFLLVINTTTNAQEPFRFTPSNIGMFESRRQMENARNAVSSSNTSDAAVGNFAGTLDIADNGSAVYTIPIPCPPGINGMEPNLSLVYNSMAGSGVLGWGWNIGGLSMINRETKNFYHDGEKEGTKWLEGSPYSLGGQRLIKVREWGTDSIEYCPENDVTMRVVGVEITERGPKIFRVHSKDGMILYYGSVDTQIHNSNLGGFYPLLGSPNASGYYAYLWNLGWALVYMQDRNNNFIEYKYTTEITSFIILNSMKNTVLDEVIYGHSSSSGKEVTGRIKFNYKTGSDNAIRYVGGLEAQNNQILNNIEVKDGNSSVLDRYDFTYKSDEKKDYLTSVKFSNASGEFLNPLNFEWTPNQYNVGSQDILTFTGSRYVPDDQTGVESFIPVACGDIDGDGFIDLVVEVEWENKSKKPLWIVYRNTGKDSFVCVSEYEWDGEHKHTFMFHDKDGDGKDELLVGLARKHPTYNSYYYYIDCYKFVNNKMEESVSDRVQITTVNAIVPSQAKPLRFLAANLLGNNDLQFFVFSANYRIEGSYGIVSLKISEFDGQGDCKVLMTDLNGNGKNEIFFIKDKETSVYEYDTSTSKLERIIVSSDLDARDEIMTGDFNGDGNMDLLVKSYLTDKWSLYYSTAVTLLKEDMSSRIGADVPAEYVVPVDINDDGRTDIVIGGGGVRLWEVDLLISQGNGFVKMQYESATPVSVGSYVAAGNFSKGRSKDLLQARKKGRVSSVGGSDIQIVNVSRDILYNKIIKITDSFGESLSITYKSQKNPSGSTRRSSGRRAGYESDPLDNLLNIFPSDLDVVASITGPAINYEYDFSIPHYHREARGFLGFETIKSTDKINSIINEKQNRLDEKYYVLYPYKTTVKTVNGAIISEEEESYTFVDKRDKKFFLRPDSRVSRDKLSTITVTTSYLNYDDSNNPQTIVKATGEMKETQTFVYEKNGLDFYNKVKSSAIVYTLPREADYSRRQEYEYDNRGNLTKEIKDPGNSLEVAIYYENYDEYGNPGKVSKTASGMTRSSSYEYSPSGRFVKKLTNPLGETLSYTYDESRGSVKTCTDRTGTTTYTYDNFGRLIQTAYPDGVSSLSVLQWKKNYGPSEALYASYTDTPGRDSPTYIWYDKLGREICRETYDINVNMILVKTEYDKAGRIHRISEPYTETVWSGDYPTAPTGWDATYTYDTYGRTEKVVTPLGTTSYSYDGLTTTVTHPKGTDSETLNAEGQLINKKNNGKSIGYSYYTSGFLRNVIPEGGETVYMTYDLQGNLTRIKDPDAGTINYTYNGWGDLLSMQQVIHNDGKNIRTTYNYKPNGLLESKNTNGEIVSYEYDSHNRLSKSAISGKHSLRYEYDNLDRVVKQTEVVEDNKTFVFEYEYDEYGNIKKEIFPSGYYVYYHYDDFGNLIQIRNYAATSLWETKEQNPRGQITKAQQGAFPVTYEYDRGLLKSKRWGSFMDMSYNFDSQGNLSSREDRITGQKELFSYDSMNRLSSWTIYKSNVIRQSYNMGYHETTGNMIRKSDVSPQMNYGENNQSPHALTSMISSVTAAQETQAISYTDFKKVKRIEGNQNSYDLVYGIGNQRIKSVYNAKGIQNTRYYIGNYEETRDMYGNVTKYHYTAGPDGLSAVFVQTGSEVNLYYTFTDYQGSLIGLGSNPGYMVERYNYDPWGRRRHAEDWAQYVSAGTTYKLNRGYTMHEHIERSGLIDMNGRVYDPLIGSFLSPDPYIQDMGNWLNFNRYTYGYNNPMFYTDPDGELAFVPFLILAAVGFTTGYVSHGIATKNWGMDAVYSGLIGAAATVVGGGVIPGIMGSTLTMGSAINFSMNTLVNTGLGFLTPSWDFNMGAIGLKRLGFSISPIGMFTGGSTGTYFNGFTMGAGVSASYQTNYVHFNAGFSAGAGFKTSYAGAAFDNGYVRASYHGTFYGAIDKQATGTFGFKSGKFSLAWENDAWIFSGDKLRSNALEFGFGGGFVFGTNIYTNDPNAKEDPQGNTKTTVKPKKYLYGEQLESPLYFGRKIGKGIIRAGYNHPQIGNIVQNEMVHRPFGYTLFPKGDFDPNGWVQSGRYNPFTLYY